MTFIELRGYGVHGGWVNVVCERILALHEIDYNGNYGVEITLDTGKVVRVDGYLHDVRKKIEAAVRAKSGA
ncbi:hypothetical protein [Cupriavidus basilensis]|uniref:hypothetical protein n=1 Tax=Cupriavidus basilensis TaxID=68895 RepID=UPI0039F6C18D